MTLADRLAELAGLVIATQGYNHKHAMALARAVDGMLPLLRERPRLNVEAPDSTGCLCKPFPTAGGSVPWVATCNTCHRKLGT